MDCDRRYLNLPPTGIEGVTPITDAAQAPAAGSGTGSAEQVGL
jgi:hypothetical protein